MTLKFLGLISKTRKPNYPYVPPDDYSLPELSSLGLLEYPLNEHMGSSSSSSSNSSSCCVKNPIGLNEFEEISTVGDTVLATDEEEEAIMMELTVRVRDDLKSAQVISRHDEAAAGSNGVAREILLNLDIIVFGKEKNIDSCRICLGEFFTIDRCIRLQCTHIFHFRCIIMWLLSKQTCPVCRKSV